ncbi:hypothetical protein [Xanthobacter autotrophicus]|uniref:hypothetical protein n=1 Tax=Xanthobacter autotrophicus TaxID=280 RepID=UPI003D7F9089
MGATMRWISGGDEGGGLPVAMRHADPQAFPATAATMATGYVGGDPGFVDEDEPFGVRIQLAVEPGPTLFLDIGAVLLGRARGLFFR